MFINNKPTWQAVFSAGVVASIVLASGCGPHFRALRVNGQIALADQEVAIARDHFERAYRIWPEDAENLFDLGVVHMIYAKRRAADESKPATLRELDQAVNYFTRAIEAHPGMLAAIEAKNEALEMKGLYNEALDQAKWAATFVGPRARQQVFLAHELEERGDYDAALLRMRQAVAMERDSAYAHASMGRFLLRHNHRKQAIVHLCRAYRLDPLEKGVVETLADLGEPLPRTVSRADP
jgi:tetratricopeptide (TPR) repeat protein